jgi:hypothetical protein
VGIEKFFNSKAIEETINIYFRQVYNIRLDCPELPLVIQSKPGREGPRESYYPMEVLRIVQGQRVSLHKQTPKLTEQMIRKCQALVGTPLLTLKKLTIFS